MATQKKVWSVGEVAQAVSRHPDTVRNEIRRGHLRAGRLGGQIIITYSALTAWLGEDCARDLFGEPAVRRGATA